LASDEKSPTLQDVWRAGVDRLRAAGIEEAGPDAELLLMHALGKSKTELLRDWREPWPQTPALRTAWEEMLARRAAGEPVQYVIGEQYFYGRRFIVNPDVLIPRPETELLVEAIIAAGDRLWPMDGQAAPHVLDVGAGSGAIAITLAAERTKWRVTASDLSSAALTVAWLNAETLGVSARIQFVQGDLLEPIIAERDLADLGEVGQAETAAIRHPEGTSIHARTMSGLPVDILVSNPPYIPSGDLPGLQREVRDYEPHLALDGGDDGLGPYRRMAEQLKLLPVKPRIVGWEVGAGQAEEAADLLRSAGDWTEIRFVADYAGILRHVLVY